MQTEPFDLRETQCRVNALVAELRRESAAVSAAGQNIASASGGPSPYPYQGGVGQYAAGVSGYAGSNLPDAYQGIPASIAGIERVKQELQEIRGTLNHHLALWNKAYGQISAKQKEIKEVRRASDHLRDGQRIAHRERTQITNLINIINSELNLAQRAAPIHARPASRQFGHSIDDIAKHGSDLYKIGPAINYRPPITEQVVPLLDQTRYAKINVLPMIEYPNPELHRDSPDKKENLQEKAIRGLGLFENHNLRVHHVELPTYYYQMAPGSYTPRDGYEIRP